MCDELTIPPTMTAEYSAHGAVVTLSCVDGYHLVGERIIVCEDGMWIGSIPECLRGNLISEL